MTKLTTTLALGALLLATAHAQSQTFKIGDAGAMRVAQTFSFDSDAQFENFTGQTHRVTGAINFNPTTRTGSGRIVVDLASLDTGIALRNEHLRNDSWLHTAKYPTAIFETTEVKHKTGETYEVTGKLTLHGVTKVIKTESTVKYIKESDATRRAMFKGNVVNVKTTFKIKLADYGIRIPGPAQGKVAETITAKLNVFGYTG